MKLAHGQETPSTIRFRAELVRPEAGEATESWAQLHLPEDASAELPSKGTTTVEGTIDGFPFRAPLEVDGKGIRALKLSQALRKAIGASVGETVSVEITRIGDEPEVRAPMDLLEALAAAPKALALFESVTPMARRDWIRWVASAKQEETRARRIENGIDMLLHGKKRPCCFPGVHWVTKDHVAPEETWIPLPSSKSRTTGSKA